MKLECLIKKDGNFNRNKLRKLQRHIYLKNIVEKNELNPYFNILEIINKHIENGILIVNIENEDIWIEIIKICIDIMIVDTNKLEGSLDSNRANSIYQEVEMLGKSVEYLKSKGYEMKVSNNRVVLDENSFRKIQSDIEKKIIELGGLNVSKDIFESIKNKFNNTMQRYFIGKQLYSLPDKNAVKSEIPVGFLLEFCVKNFSEHKYNNGNKELYEKGLSELYLLAKSFVNILEVRKYNLFNDMFIEIEDLALYIQENIFFDKLCTLRQWNSAFIPDLTKGMFGEFFLNHKDCDKILGYSLEEYVCLEHEILERGVSKNFKIFSENDLCEKLPHVNPKSIREILRVISHERNKINKGFCSINSKTDFHKKPLIKLKGHKFLLINSSLCSYSFIEAMENSLRKMFCKKSFNVDFDGRMGGILEEYIKNKLKEKSINYESGFYGVDGECDIIIETNEKIIFIEIKKKALTQSAQCGDSISFFKDIARSILASQKQMGRHELELLKKGSIELREHRSVKKSKNKSKVTIEYRGRMVERVSLGFHDFGFINESNITSNIIELLTRADVESLDKNRAFELNEFEKVIEQLRNQAYEILNLTNNKRNLRELYFNILFISLQQFLMILNGSKNKEDFVENLFLSNYVTMGSDPYKSYYNFKRL